YSFIYPGCGYGGSCFPKDVSAFIKIAEKNGYDFSLLKEVEKINREQLTFFLKKIHAALWNLSGKKIAVLGLSFKPGTDDMREAPSIKVIEFLLSEGAVVTAYDPVAVDNAKKFFPMAKFAASPMEAVEGADAAVFLTEWSEFAQLDLGSVKKRMKNPVVFDARNIFDPLKMKLLGFSYHCVGRNSGAGETD
ncbi:MAG: UDP binding domain-containing protein, partial [archaeon]|nr:UDP binding domain-containing protein [archaeon]